MPKMTALLLLALPLLTSEVCAEQITIEGVARSASSFAAVAAICPKFFSVNVTEARKYQQTFLTAGTRAYGEKLFTKTVKRELDRRYREIEITGPAQWCAYQRAHIERMGGGKVFEGAERRLTSDDMAMLVATLVVAGDSCRLKTTDAPLNLAVARYGFDIVDFKPDGLYAPVVEVKIRKAKDFIQSLGPANGCSGLTETIRKFFQELVQ
jgi:hypothetical protein